MKGLLIFLMIIAACVPMEKPKHNLLMPQLLGAGSSAPPADIVRTTLLDDAFPSTGPQALAPGERAVLTGNMYARYKAGYYDPARIPGIVEEFHGLEEEAAVDGVTHQSMLADFEAEIRAKIDQFPMEMLHKIRYVSGNSIVLSMEVLENPAYEVYGLDPELMKTNLAAMKRIRILVTDELERRK